MSRYIDADKLKQHYAYWGSSKYDYMQEEKKLFDDIVDQQPTADVVPMDYHERCLSVEIQKRMNMVEVVRCKDCVYRPCLIMPHSSDFDFCSYGERTEE